MEYLWYMQVLYSKKMRILAVAPVLAVSIEMMDSIKSRIHRRITPEQVKVKRLAYKSYLPDFRFKRVNITGANEQQKQYASN